jgi:AraC-like DNA-binding protein
MCHHDSNDFSVATKMKKRSARRLPIISEAPPLEPIDQRIITTVAVMRRHIASPLSVPQLAKLANMSRSHFAELFRSQTGCPVLQYSIRLRMERAAELIHMGNQRMNHIASELGFRDPLYFSRQFRRVYGVPPTEYRLLKTGSAANQ